VTSEKHAWDRLPDENEPAWRAFVLYREMQNRTFREAYRKWSGKPRASQCSGKFSKWVKDFQWIERAKAFDERLQAASLGKQLARVEQAGDVWALRLIENRENSALGAGLILQKWMTLAKWPLTQQEVKEDEDGKTRITIIKPVSWQALESATRSAKMAMEIAGAVGALTVKKDDEGDGPTAAQVLVLIAPQVSQANGHAADQVNGHAPLTIENAVRVIDPKSA